jgi:hypothetical protein
VGNNKESGAKMGEAAKGCGYATPFCITPEAGQVSENTSKSGTKEAWDVFQEDVGLWKVSGHTPNLGP